MTETARMQQIRDELLAASRRCWRPWHWRLFGRRIVPTGDVLALLAIKYGDDDDGPWHD